MKRLRIFICCLLSVIVVSMSGCKPKISKNSGDESYVPNLNIDKNITAELSILCPVGDYEENIIKALIADFKGIYPNVNFKTLSVQIGDTYQGTIMQQFQSGILPDIIWTDSTTSFYYLVGKKIALNLTPYIEASEAAGVFNVENDFYSAIFDMCSYDNKLYMVPRSHDNVVTIINTEQFAAAGVEWEKYKNGWTWEDLKDVCAKIRKYYDETLKKPKYYPLNAPFNWAPLYGTMLESYNAKVFDGLNVAIDSEATREVLNELRGLATKRYVASTAADGASENGFYDGNQAMIFSSEPLARNFNTDLLRNKVDVLPYPLMQAHNNPKIGSGSAGYSINANTKNRDLAWAFLSFMLSEAGQQTMAVAGMRTAPIRRSLADYNTYRWGEGFRDKNLAAYLYGDEYLMTPTFFTAFSPDLTYDITDAVETLMNNALNPNRDIEKSIEDCVEDLNYAIG